MSWAGYGGELKIEMSRLMSRVGYWAEYDIELSWILSRAEYWTEQAIELSWILSRVWYIELSWILSRAENWTEQAIEPSWILSRVGYWAEVDIMLGFYWAEVDIGSICEAGVKRSILFSDRSDNFLSNYCLLPLCSLLTLYICMRCTYSTARIYIAQMYEYSSWCLHAYI